MINTGKESIKLRIMLGSVTACRTVVSWSELPWMINTIIDKPWTINVPDNTTSSCIKKENRQILSLRKKAMPVIIR